MTTPVRVLVVDDEPVVRDAIRRVLEAEGMQVALASSGEEALHDDALTDCELLLCDLMLPGMSGIEVVRAVRARRPDLPIVAITGYATGEVRAAAEAAGASDFLSKPFDHSELLDRVRGALEHRGVAWKEGPP